MNCKKCGAENDATSIFCSKCGTRQNSRATEEHPGPNPPNESSAPSSFWRFLKISLITGVVIICFMFLMGSWEIEKKQKDAFNSTKHIAESGNANFQRELGHMYYEGIGVDQDYARALEW